MGLLYPPIMVMNSNAAAQPSGITVGSSPYTYVNADLTPVSVLISGGTVTTIAFSRDNTNYLTIGLLGGMYLLNPGDRIRITYVLAPIMTKIPR